MLMASFGFFSSRKRQKLHVSSALWEVASQPKFDDNPTCATSFYDQKKTLKNGVCGCVNCLLFFLKDLLFPATVQLRFPCCYFMYSFYSQVLPMQSLATTVLLWTLTWHGAMFMQQALRLTAAIKPRTSPVPHLDRTWNMETNMETTCLNSRITSKSTANKNSYNSLSFVIPGGRLCGWDSNCTSSDACFQFTWLPITTSQSQWITMPPSITRLTLVSRLPSTTECASTFHIFQRRYWGELFGCHLWHRSEGMHNNVG